MTDDKLERAGFLKYTIGGLKAKIDILESAIDNGWELPIYYKDTGTDIFLNRWEMEPVLIRLRAELELLIVEYRRL
jgi:hypothetical protein